jgi:cyclase
MLRTRVIPALLLKGSGLVKTVKFGKPNYLGDPINIVRIFNEKEVDEIIIADISATSEGRGPDFGLIADIASECFMPLTYGGGITSTDDIRRLLKVGVEKVAINTAAAETPDLVRQGAALAGSSSIVVSIDVGRSLFGGYSVFTRGGKHNLRRGPEEYAKQMEELGAGELLLNSIERDGTMSGFDIELIKRVAASVSIPVVALGGAAQLGDFKRAVEEGGAAAVAAGSMFVYQGRHRAVLVSYPSQSDLGNVLGYA